jgi:hypothetical protein
MLHKKHLPCFCWADILDRVCRSMLSTAINTLQLTGGSLICCVSCNAAVNTVGDVYTAFSSVHGRIGRANFASNGLGAWMQLKYQEFKIH